MTHEPRKQRMRWPAAVVIAAAIGVVAAACGRDPFSFNWDDTPHTVLLYSLARPELNLVSGFAFFQGVRVRVESPSATGTWDAAVDTRGGEIVLLPPGALGVIGSARITTFEGMTLEDVIEAPVDTLAYVADQPVPVRSGNVYVVKTNRTTGSFGSSCSYYAKLEPVDIDVVGGSLTFRYVASPICNSRNLVPPR